MAASKSVVYGCDICGTEVSVTGEGLANLSPIYCCGVAVSERKKEKGRGAKKVARKTSAKKPSRKTASRRTARKAGKK